MLTPDSVPLEPTLPLAGLPAGPVADPAADKVVAALTQGTLKFAARMGRVLRTSYDQLYQGARTGRYQVAQLSDAERRHFASLVELGLAQEFPELMLPGRRVSFQVAGVELACVVDWQVSPECMGELMLGISCADEPSQFSLGIVRCRQEWLDPGRQLTAIGQDNIRWLAHNEPFPAQPLADPTTRKAVFGAAEPAGRLAELCRRALGQVLSPGVLATVAAPIGAHLPAAQQLLVREGILLVACPGAFFGNSIARQLIELWQLPSCPPADAIIPVRLRPAGADAPGAVLIGGQVFAPGSAPADSPAAFDAAAVDRLTLASGEGMLPLGF